MRAIDEREEFIGRLRSTLKAGYWYCTSRSYGEDVALSTLMGIDQSELLAELTAAKLFGKGSMNDEELFGRGLCKRKYGGKTGNMIWFALLVDGEEPTEGPEQQVGEKFTLGQEDSSNPAKKRPMVGDRTASKKKKKAVVAQELFNEVAQRCEDLAQKLQQSIADRTKDEATAASQLAAEREKHFRELKSIEASIVQPMSWQIETLNAQLNAKTQECTFLSQECTLLSQLQTQFTYGQL